MFTGQNKGIVICISGHCSLSQILRTRNPATDLYSRLTTILSYDLKSNSHHNKSWIKFACQFFHYTDLLYRAREIGKSYSRFLPRTPHFLTDIFFRLNCIHQLTDIMNYWNFVTYASLAEFNQNRSNGISEWIMGITDGHYVPIMRAHYVFTVWRSQDEPLRTKLRYVADYYRSEQQVLASICCHIYEFYFHWSSDTFSSPLNAAKSLICKCTLSVMNGVKNWRMWTRG